MVRQFFKILQQMLYKSVSDRFGKFDIKGLIKHYGLVIFLKSFCQIVIANNFFFEVIPRNVWKVIATFLNGNFTASL